MRRLLPEPGDVDPLDAFDITRTPPPGRPWVVGLMVASADGAAAVDGRSGGLGGTGDREVFRAVRALADVVLVGAGTVRDEGYGPVRTSPAVQARRAARGQAPTPRLAIVSARLDLPSDLRIFTEADADAPPPLVLHPPSVDPRARAALAGRTETVEVAATPDGGVDAHALLATLHRRGARVVVCEGGPRLNGTLVAADLLDELSLSLDPMVVGGPAPRIVVDAAAAVGRRWRTAGLLEHDGVLFWRTVRQRDGG